MPSQGVLSKVRRENSLMQHGSWNDTFGVLRLALVRSANSLRMTVQRLLKLPNYQLTQLPNYPISNKHLFVGFAGIAFRLAAGAVGAQDAQPGAVGLHDGLDAPYRSQHAVL